MTANLALSFDRVGGAGVINQGRKPLRQMNTPKHCRLRLRSTLVVGCSRTLSFGLAYTGPADY